MLTQKPWRAEAVIQLIAGVFTCLCVGVLLAGVLQKIGVPAFKKEDSLANILLATLSFQGACWVLILIFLKHHGVNWRAAFGFCNTNLTKSLLLAAGVLVIVLPIILELEQFSAQFLQKIGWPPTDQPAVELILNA